MIFFYILEKGIFSIYGNKNFLYIIFVSIYKNFFFSKYRNIFFIYGSLKYIYEKYIYIYGNN